MTGLRLSILREVRAVGRWFNRNRKRDDEPPRESTPSEPVIEITVTQGGRSTTKTIGGPTAFGMQYHAFHEQYGATDARTLAAGTRYAQELMRGNDVDEAVAVYQEIVALRSSALGPAHPDTLRNKHSLAFALWQRGSHAEAERVQRDAYEARRRVLGDGDAETLRSGNNLGWLLIELRRMDEAEPLLRRVADGMARTLGRDDAETLACQMKLAGLQHLQGHSQQAERGLRDVVQRLTRKVGPTSPVTLQARSNLLVVLLDNGRAAEAVEAARTLADDAGRALSNTDGVRLHARHSLARALAGVDRRAEAIGLLADTLPDSERGRGVDHPGTLEMRMLFAQLLVEAGDRRAGSEARAALAGCERVHGPGHPDTEKARALVRLIDGR
ncbi:tetratricopeptide repeat protein [Micromonospora sp. NPDC023888]|uniref:tetratricopeptide repeat protein n=1 Tax=Micromonospora sp. NPDC023888 TaxID=3155607 RepID=UPI00340AB934